MKLLKIEWAKIKGHSFFLIGMGLYVACLVLLVVGAGEFELFGDRKSEEGGIIPLSSLGDLGFYDLPDLWQNIAWLTGWLKFILAFIVIYYYANEYKYRTYRQNLIDGLSKGQFFTSKILIIIVFSLVSVLILGISGLFAGLSHNPDAGISDFLNGSEYLIAYFVEILFLIIFAFFLATLVKSSTIAIIIMVVYYIMAEPILGGFVLTEIKDYLPTNPSRELTTEPITRLTQLDELMGLETPNKLPMKFLILTIVYTFVFGLSSYLILKKRDA